MKFHDRLDRKIMEKVLNGNNVKQILASFRGMLQQKPAWNARQNLF